MPAEPGDAFGREFPDPEAPARPFRGPKAGQFDLCRAANRGSTAPRAAEVYLFIFIPDSDSIVRYQEAYFLADKAVEDIIF